VRGEGSCQSPQVSTWTKSELRTHWDAEQGTRPTEAEATGEKSLCLTLPGRPAGPELTTQPLI
jgi:hypothetical protein